MAGFLRALVFKPSTIIFLIMGATLVALFAMYFHREPGYLMLAVGGYVLEASAIVAFVVLFLLVFLVFLFYRLLLWLFDRNRRKKNALNKTMQGLALYNQANWEKAEKLLVKAAPKNSVPVVNYVAAAKAAHQRADLDKRDEYLREADAACGEDEFSVQLVKARLQYDIGQWESCLATLQLLSEDKKQPGYPTVLKMLAMVYGKLEDWKKLEQLLPEIKNQRVFDRDNYRIMVRGCYQGRLEQAVAPGSASADQLQEVKQIWQNLPKASRKDAALIKTYCERLIALGAENEAEQEITSYLKKSWDDRLVRLYGVVSSEDVEKQMLLAESWLQERPNNSVLLLTLGRLSMQLQKWDKARTYFESSLNSRKSAEAYGELGRLLGYLGEHRASNDSFQKGLAMMSQRLPDLPLPVSAVATEGNQQAASVTESTPETHAVAEQNPTK